MKLAGVILAGGRSRRMGRDKALLTLDGSTFLQRSVDDMRPVCARIFVLASPGQVLPLPDDVEMVVDAAPFQGPAVSLLDFARRCEAQWLFVRAVDMPLASASEFICRVDFDKMADGCLASIDGREQPLFAIYRRRALLNICLKGKRSMFQLLQGLRMGKISFTGARWENFNYQHQLPEGVS